MSGSIDKTDCATIRQSYREGLLQRELADQFGVSRSSIRYHLSGDCGHDHDIAPVQTAEKQGMPGSTCERLRDQFDTGGTIDELVESAEWSRQTVLHHLLGDCEHKAGPVASETDVLKRVPISREDCAMLRRRTREQDSVREVAKEVTWEYQSVLRHVNGECGHRYIPVDPRETSDRAEDVDKALCGEMRATYRDDVEVTYSQLAERYDCSPTTVERHIEFRCNHEPESSLAFEVSGIDDLLEPAGAEEAPGESTVAQNSEEVPPTHSGESTGPEHNRDADEKESLHDTAGSEEGRTEMAEGEKSQQEPLSPDPRGESGSEEDAKRATVAIDRTLVSICRDRLQDSKHTSMAELADAAVTELVTDHVAGENIDSLASNQHVETTEITLSHHLRRYTDFISQTDDWAFESCQALIETALRSYLDVPAPDETVTISLPSDVVTAVRESKVGSNNKFPSHYRQLREAIMSSSESSR